GVARRLRSRRQVDDQVVRRRVRDDARSRAVDRFDDRRERDGKLLGASPLDGIEDRVADDDGTRRRMLLAEGVTLGRVGWERVLGRPAFRRTIVGLGWRGRRATRAYASEKPHDCERGPEHDEASGWAKAPRRRSSTAQRFTREPR